MDTSQIHSLENICQYEYSKHVELALDHREFFLTCTHSSLGLSSQIQVASLQRFFFFQEIHLEMLI